MLSILELRRIFEGAFWPLQCSCAAADGESLSIQVKDPDTGRVLINVAGLSKAELCSSRAISRVVLQIRQDLEALKNQAAVGRRLNG